MQCLCNIHKMQAIAALSSRVGRFLAFLTCPTCVPPRFVVSLSKIKKMTKKNFPVTGSYSWSDILGHSLHKGQPNFVLQGGRILRVLQKFKLTLVTKCANYCYCYLLQKLAELGLKPKNYSFLE
jgi:hypothetical protein